MKSSIRFLSAFRRKPGTFRYNRSEPEQTSLHTAKRRGWLELQQKDWRRGPDSNRRIEVLQTSALPLGYRATSGGPWPMAQPPPRRGSRETLERETGFEPATSTLARSHSTTELLPHPIRDFTALAAQGSIAIPARPARPTPAHPAGSKGTSRRNLAASSGGVGLM